VTALELNATPVEIAQALGLLVLKLVQFLPLLLLLE
jgi:hypothetical protein